MTQSNIHRVLIGRYQSNFADGTVYIRHIKLEKGNKATDWCMSDNDVNKRIQDQADALTAYQAEVKRTYALSSSVYTKTETQTRENVLKNSTLNDLKATDDWKKLIKINQNSSWIQDATGFQQQVWKYNLDSSSELIGKKSFEDSAVGNWCCADFKTPATLQKGGPVNGFYNWVYSSTGGDLYYGTSWIPVKPGTKFYVEALCSNMKSSGTNVIVAAYLRHEQGGRPHWATGPSAAIAPGHWGWIKGVVVVPDDVTQILPCIATKEPTGKGVASCVAYASFKKLDDYTQSNMTSIKQSSDGIGLKVAQLVGGSDISKIDMTSSAIKIDSKHILLNGDVAIDGTTFAKKIKATGITADMMLAGTIDAAKINVININASKIATGVLNGIKITSTGKDPSGTSSTTNIQSGYIDTNVINCSDYILVGKADADPRKRWQTKQTPQGMWFQTPAKITGHTGNAVSDWQTEWQGFMGGDGWNYRNTTVTGTGYSGIQLALTPQQEWGNPYGGDMMSFGTWIRTETSNKTKNILDGTLDPFLWYSYTGQSAAYKNTVVIPKPLRVFGETHFDWDIHVKGGGSHGIRTAWVSWSDWGSNQKVPCIVQDKDNWGGIAFPANGRVVLFTHDYRVNTDSLPRDKGGRYNGWGS